MMLWRRCEGVMRSVNVQAAMSKKMHDGFEKREEKWRNGINSDWYWCLVTGCDKGQLHPQEAGIICTCHACGARACVSCERPYHEGEVCDAYRLCTREKREEEEQAKGVIKRMTKKCPGCGVAVGKNGGCEYVWYKMKLHGIVNLHRNFDVGSH
jgi:hypothetical protein